MRQERTSPVLIAMADRTARSKTSHVLHKAEFEVWQAEDVDDALTQLHASPRRLVVLVDPGMAALFRFAASDRRLTYLHVYIALNTPDARHEDGVYALYPCLTLLKLALPSEHELLSVTAAAARALGGGLVRSTELAVR
jgi:hypothetical protein